MVIEEGNKKVTNPNNKKIKRFKMDLINADIGSIEHAVLVPFYDDQLNNIDDIPKRF
jgi:hypothetical protein